MHLIDLEMEARVLEQTRVAVSRVGEEGSATDPCADRDVEMEANVSLLTRVIVNQDTLGTRVEMVDRIFFYSFITLSFKYFSCV